MATASRAGGVVLEAKIKEGSATLFADISTPGHRGLSESEILEILGLERGGPLEITARLSRSGDAVAARGDLEGVARGVAVGAKDARITLDTVHE